MTKKKTGKQLATKDPQKPMISVIMSVYNGADHLHEAIDSILGQTYRNFELIIVNDGSTDETEAIIKSYDDKRIRLVSQPNHGLVYSLNKAIGLARGQFIARHDADDISLPSRFEKELQLMLTNPKLGVVGTFFTYINEEGESSSVTITGPTESVDIKRSLYFHNPFGHGTVMIRKAAVDDVGPYSEAYGPTEDFELWRRMSHDWEFGIVPESLYLYRINPNGISQKKNKIQNEFAQKHIAEQWASPFIYKMVGHIVRDGHNYKKLPSLYAHQVYGQYVAQQVDIARALLNQGRLRVGSLAAIATLRLKPRSWHYFIKPFLRGILVRLRPRG